MLAREREREHESCSFSSLWCDIFFSPNGVNSRFPDYRNFTDCALFILFFSFFKSWKEGRKFLVHLKEDFFEFASV